VRWQKDDCSGCPPLSGLPAAAAVAAAPAAAVPPQTLAPIIPAPCMMPAPNCVACMAVRSLCVPERVWVQPVCVVGLQGWHSMADDGADANRAMQERVQAAWLVQILAAQSAARAAQRVRVLKIASTPPSSAHPISHNSNHATKTCNAPPAG
jgi:hypothetical protein